MGRGAVLVGLTGSVWMAALPEDAKTAIALVEAADRAMFKAKSRGKDRVEEAG